MKKLISVLVLFAMLFVCACNNSNETVSDTSEFTKLFEKDDLPRLDGSTANIPLAALMLQRIAGMSEEEAYDAAQFTTTTNAYQNLLYGNTDLLLVYEGDNYYMEQDDLNKLEFHVIGKDALVFITNVHNGVGGLSVDQIQNIYSGDTTNWKDLSGADAEIMAYTRSSGSGSQVLMEKLVMNGKEFGPEIAEKQIGTMGGLIDAVATYKNGEESIGYSVYYYIKNMYGNNEQIKLFSVNGIKPSNETISDGSYPFINDFYAVIKKDSPKNSSTRKLLNWILSEEGKQTIKDAGYVGN